MNWNSFHVLDLFIRMTLNSKSAVFDQQRNQGKEFHSTEDFRIQADGAWDILKMWLPRSITQVFTSRRLTKIKDSGETPTGGKSHWPEYISLARTWLGGFYLTAREAGEWSLACPGGKGARFVEQLGRVPLWARRGFGCSRRGWLSTTASRMDAAWASGISFCNSWAVSLLDNQNAFNGTIF